jgi:multidrug resistance efflux pump
MSEFNQVTFLSALVNLEKRLRQAQNIDELSYRLANESRNLVQYDQLIVWSYAKKGLKICAVSGVDRVAALTPFFQQIQTLLMHLRSKGDGASVYPLARAELLTCPGGEVFAQMPWQHMLWVPICTEKNQPCAGMVVLREQTNWSDQEKKLFEHLSETAHHAWKALQPRFERAPVQRRWIQWLVVLLVLAVCCFPVRLSVLAEGEVVAEQMVLVSSALDGIVAQFYVQPNQAVKQGQLLVSLDQTALSNQLNVARQTYEVVKAQAQHAQQRAFRDPEARETVHLFQAQMAQKKAEMDYAESLLQRTLITAPRDGIAVFNDENDWLGRPVVVGEKILTVASPESVQLRVKMPVNEAIQLDHDQPLTFFLNVAPTKPLAATIDQIGYETVLDPILGPVYPIAASFMPQPDFPVRIGSRGSARLYGRQVALIYAVLRKPLTRLRIFVGM